RKVAGVARRPAPGSVHPEPVSRNEVCPDRADDGHFREDRRSAAQPGPPGPPKTSERLPVIGPRNLSGARGYRGRLRVCLREAQAFLESRSARFQKRRSRINSFSCGVAALWPIREFWEMRKNRAFA